MLRVSCNMRVTRTGEGGVSPVIFRNIGKSAQICGKNVLIVIIYGQNSSFKMQFLRVSRPKNRIFLPCGSFLARAVRESLWKCPNLKKTRLPVKISWLRACEIIRVFTMIGKKSVRASAVFDSVFKISPFLVMLIVSLKYDLYEND